MISFDPPSWIHHLGFSYFLKKSRNNGTKLKQNQATMLIIWLYKFMNFSNLMKKTDKKLQNYLWTKIWFLARPTRNLMVAMAKSNLMDMQMTFQNFCRDQIWTATESFSPLGQMIFSELWKNLIRVATPPQHLLCLRPNNTQHGSINTCTSLWYTMMTIYAMLSSGIPWNILRVFCVFTRKLKGTVTKGEFQRKNCG